MKLLTIVSSMNPELGGVAEAIRTCISVWRDNDITTDIVTTDGAHLSFVENDNIIGLGERPNCWGYSKKLEIWLLKHLHFYDVIIVHGLWLYNNFILNKVVKQIKKEGKNTPKIFLMPHGMLDPYFQKAKNRKLKAIRNVIYWHLIEKHLVNNAQALLFTCDEEMRLAKLTFRGYKPKCSYNVGLGIMPPPSYNCNQRQAFRDKCTTIGERGYLLFLGRINLKKGLNMLIDAYKIVLNKQNLDSQLLPKLVIAGPGLKTEYGLALTKQIQLDTDLKDNVEIVDMLEGDSKWGAFYGCEAFFLPSHQENFGLTVAEALACKKPVLISNKVNIHSEITKTNCGLVANDDLEGTICLLNNWINLSVSDKNTMSINAYNTFNSKFLATKTAMNIIETIQSHIALEK